MMNIRWYYYQEVV